MSVQIAPSILAADFAALGEAVKLAERGGADFIHVDVMDGHFVPNITIGPPVVAALGRATSLPLDVHLMIAEPDRYVDAFVQAGASVLTVHVEPLPHLHRTIEYIRSLGIRVGVALNPATPVTALEEIAADVDLVLIMTVNPGFGGQRFIERSVPKIRLARALIDRAGGRARIEVDGGIDRDTAPRVASAGAEILVAGSAVFREADPVAAIGALRAAAESGRRRADEA